MRTARAVPWPLNALLILALIPVAAVVMIVVAIALLLGHGRVSVSPPLNVYWERS